MSADNKKRDGVTTVVQFSALTEKRLLEWRHKFAALSKKRSGHQQLCSDVSGQQEKGACMRHLGLLLWARKWCSSGHQQLCYADSENLSTRKAWLSEKWGINDYVTEIVSTHSADNKKRLIKVKLIADIQWQPNGCDRGLFTLAEASELVLWCATGMFLKCERCLVHSQDELSLFPFFLLQSLIILFNLPLSILSLISCVCTLK